MAGHRGSSGATRPTAHRAASTQGTPGSASVWSLAKVTLVDSEDKGKQSRKERLVLEHFGPLAFLFSLESH